MGKSFKRFPESGQHRARERVTRVAGESINGGRAATRTGRNGCEGIDKPDEHASDDTGRCKRLTQSRSGRLAARRGLPDAPRSVRPSRRLSPPDAGRGRATRDRPAGPTPRHRRRNHASPGPAGHTPRPTVRRTLRRALDAWARARHKLCSLPQGPRPVRAYLAVARLCWRRSTS